MIPLKKPVLLAAVAGVVAILAIGVAAWRLYLANERMASDAPPPAPAVASRADRASGVTPPTGAPAATTPSPSASSVMTPTAPSAPAPVGSPPGADALASAPAAAPSAPGAPAAGTAPAAGKPSFDVVRIDPAGDAVVAGRAEPRSQVSLTLSGRPIAEAQADADGQFVMLPPKLPPGDHVLALRATGPNGETISEQSVTIAVPQRGEQGAVAALTAPNKPTVVLAQPDAPAGGQPTDLRIASVEAQQGGAFFASGVAPPGANLRLYLNESYVASVEPGADGKWSVRVERGMSPGGYRVRVDRVGPDGRAVARVEAPFDYPAELARPAPAAAGATPSATVAADPGAGAASGQAAGAGQHAVVGEVRTARVQRGDSLWRISATIYGEGIRYTQIYDANASQIRNPDLIYPGQVLVVPKQDEQKPSGAAERRR